MKRIILIPILVLALLNGIYAQISVSGKVVGKDVKEPLVGAHVWKKNNYKISDVTNSQGYFRIAGLHKEDTLIFSFIGYQELYFVVNDEFSNTEIIMKPISNQLDMVEVKATILGAENFAFEKLTPLDIYINPNSKADALVAINTNMSSTTKDENAAVAFRGGSPQQTGYFLNGVPVKNPVKYSQLTNTGTLSIFNTDFLKSATVFPGNPPLEYGQATSGTIVLELADRFQDQWKHTASISMANLGYSTNGKIGKKSYLGVFGNYQFGNILKDVNSVNFKDINSFKAMEGGALFTTHHAWGSVKIYQYGLIDQYSFKYQHPSFPGNFLQNSKRSLTTVQWLQEFGSWQASLVAGNSLNSNSFVFGNMDYEVQSHDPYTSANLTYSENDNILKTGYAYWGQYNAINGSVPSLDFALSPDHPSNSILNSESLESHELYIYGRKKWGDHALGSGLRTAFIPRSNQQLWSYQINYSQTLSTRLTLKAGHGKYYQTRIDTQPQVMDQSQSNVDINFKEKGYAISQSFFRNHGDIPISGSETRVSVFHNNKLQIDQTASFYHQSTSWDWFLRTFLKYNPASDWTLNLSFQSFKGNSYRLVETVVYRSELNVFAPQQFSELRFFDPYKNVSLGVSKMFQFSEKLNGIFFMNMANIFDFKNENSLTYNEDYSAYNSNFLTRRSLYAGVILNFVSN